MLATAPEIARMLRRTERQVRNLRGDGLPAVRRRGRWLYPVPDVVAWWTERRAQRAAEMVRGADYRAAHRAHVWSKARLACRRLRRVGGELVTRERAAGWLADVRERFREAVVEWGTDLGPQLTGIDSAGIAAVRLQDAADTLLARLRDAYPPDEGAAGETDPLPEDDPALSYEDAISRGNAIRLNALARVHDLIGLRDSGEAVAVRDVLRELHTLGLVLQPMIRGLHARYAPQVAGADDPTVAAVVRALTAELVEAVAGPERVRLVA